MNPERNLLKMGPAQGNELPSTDITVRNKISAGGPNEEIRDNIIAMIKSVADMQTGDMPQSGTSSLVASKGGNNQPVTPKLGNKARTRKRPHPYAKKTYKQVLHTPKTFGRFQKLPKELRLRIWELAIAQRNRDGVLLPVLTSINPALEGPRILFTVFTYFERKCHDWCKGLFTKNKGKLVVSGLSLANVESRKVFLKTYPKVLHTPKGGLIRYNPANTIIRIISSLELIEEDRGSSMTAILRGPSRTSDFPRRDAIKADAALSLWPSDIQHLQFDVKRQQSLSRFCDLLQVHQNFPRLKSISQMRNYQRGGFDTLRDAQATQDMLDGLAAKNGGHHAAKILILEFGMKIIGTATRLAELRGKMLALDELEPEAEEGTSGETAST